MSQDFFVFSNEGLLMIRNFYFYDSEHFCNHTMLMRTTTLTEFTFAVYDIG